MNDAKQTIFSAIRSGLDKNGSTSATRAQLVRARLSAPPPHLVPAGGRRTGAARMAQFVRMATEASVTFSEAASPAAVPETVADYLRTQGLGPRFVMASDPALTAMPWSAAGLFPRQDRAREEDMTAVTAAVAGVAETGGLVLASGPLHPYTLNFLPFHHLVVLPAHRVVGAWEDAVDLLARERGSAFPPRAMVMAIGPSRSADIGYALQLGAHGPGRLHCILVEETRG